MQKSNAQILDHFYGLLLEMNFHRPDEDVFEGKNYQDDPFILKHLRQIKLKSAKYKALHNKSGYLAILDEIKRLKAIGADELKKLLNPEQQQQLLPLFRKFEELTGKDEASIADDEELLQLIRALKNKLDQSGKSSGDE